MLLPADLFWNGKKRDRVTRKRIFVEKFESQNAGKENFLRNLNFFYNRVWKMSFLRLTFFHLYRMILEKKFYFYVNFAVQIWYYKS